MVTRSPLIIEWDATDMSSFQGFTSDDVVLVKYEGCSLQVLDGCRSGARSARRARAQLGTPGLAEEGALAPARWSP